MTLPMRSPRAKSRARPLRATIFYCLFHDVRSFAWSHPVRFTDEDGRCHAMLCRRAKQFREVLPAPRKKGAKR